MAQRLDGHIDRRGPNPRSGPPHLINAPAEPAIDREKTCPLLMRVFFKEGGHHDLKEFQRRGKEPSDEVQIYTWMDATLREMSDLLKEVKQAARAPRTRLSFSLVYPDRYGRYVIRQVGVVHALKPSEDDLKTLKGLKFQTGDFMDVALLA